MTQPSSPTMPERDYGKVVEALRALSYQQDSAWHSDKAVYATKPRALLYASATAIEALQARVEALEAAARPFAQLARPINGEAGRPSEIDVITNKGEYDELRLESYTYATRGAATLDAEDFRRLAALLPVDGGERG